MGFKLDECKYFLEQTSLTLGNAEGFFSLEVLSTLAYCLSVLLLRLLKPP